MNPKPMYGRFEFKQRFFGMKDGMIDMNSPRSEPLKSDCSQMTQMLPDVLSEEAY